MVFLTGWQKNFSATSDNPAQAVNWESQYRVLAESVDIIDQRQKIAVCVVVIARTRSPYTSQGVRHGLWRCPINSRN